ncbi:MAG: tyrosine-protein phosphatase [Clostridia bacterium]|nr:tyrosine-protein phosphatase [Clostridia bacterium]
MKKNGLLSASRAISFLLTLTLILSCLGVLPAGLTACAETADAPVIVNAGFETGTASPWILGGNSEIVAGGRDGSAYALKVAGAKWTHVKQQISVSPNTDYRITGWVKRVSGTGAHYLYAKGEGDKSIPAINGTRQYFTYMDSDWVMHKWEFNSGSFTTINIDMVIEDPDSVFLYDDISIKELLPSSFDGYIYNGNFETGDYNPWSIKSPAGVVAGGRNGSDYAFRMEGGQWSSASQNVEVEPHTDYRLTGWVKRVSGTGAHYLYAKDQNGGNISAINGTKQWFNQTTTEWVEHVWEFNSGTFSYIKIYMTVEDPNSVFLYDDITLEKLCTASFDGYITNGDLETGSAGGWDLNDGSTIVPGGYNSGYALKVGGSAGTAVTQNVKVEGLTDYRLTVRIKRISGRGAHSILAKKGDSVLENINGTDGKITFTDRKWHEQSIEFNSGRTAVITICLHVDAASAVFIYDDITLEKIGAVDYSDVLKGDVTLDGVIDETDLALAERAIKGDTELEGAAEYAADMNYDGKVNEDDASLLRVYLGSGSASAVLLTPARGETVANASWQIDELLTNYRPGKSDEYSGIGSRPDQYMRDTVVLHWMFAGEASGYTVLLADNPELIGAKEYNVTEPTLSIQNLLVNTDYYWAVEVDGARSEVGTFHTADTVRTLWIEGVSNTRDIGGWKTVDGTQRVKYGIAYRGAKFDDFTEAGKQAIIDLGIKTDVDLRGNNEGVNEPLKKLGVTWYLAGYYGCAMYNGTDSTSIERIGSNHVNGIINALRAYADPANYPAYFHCSYGRDRTGTLGLLLLGLLGVSKTDIQKDYEMTFLSEWGGGGLSAEGHVSLLNRTISWIQTNYAQGGTLQESIEAYVLAAGLSADEIAAIRANMLEPVPEEAAVTGMEIASEPDKTEYTEGDLLDLNGGKLAVTFSDGAVKEVKMSIDMVSGFDRNAAGDQTLTVTYAGFTAQFDVEVKGKTMTRIEITALPEKREYTEGEEFDPAGLEVTAYYDNDAQEVLSADAYEISGYESTVGEHTITITVGEFTDSFNVTVVSGFIRGDLDGDGEITVADALAALRIAAKLAEETPRAIAIGDADGDGHITVADALAILRVAAKLADTL